MRKGEEEGQEGQEGQDGADCVSQRTCVDRYFKDELMNNLNKGLFTFAPYNAGPGRIHQLRKELEKRGLDPNVYFGNVEQVASERIGREAVTYVSNICKYYIAYRLVVEEDARRAAAKESIRSQAGESGRQVRTRRKPSFRRLPGHQTWVGFELELDRVDAYWVARLDSVVVAKS